MPKPPLTVHNAEIRTATVEIKTLTVSGKQVTLAVFRQLMSEALFDRDLNPRGTPWGVVNYHPDKCADWEQHVHVVWQHGADLRRSLFRAPRSARLGGSAAHVAFVAAVRDGLHQQIGAIKPETFGFSEIEIGYAFGDSGALDKDHASVEFLHGYVHYKIRVARSVARAYQNESAMAAVVKEHAASLPSMEAAIAALPSDKYLNVWREMRDLPQLFIAV